MRARALNALAHSQYRVIWNFGAKIRYAGSPTGVGLYADEKVSLPPRLCLSPSCSKAHISRADTKRKSTASQREAALGGGGESHSRGTASTGLALRVRFVVVRALCERKMRECSRYGASCLSASFRSTFCFLIFVDLFWFRRRRWLVCL